MAAPLSSELHDLLIRPSNGSLILGAAHHALYRPANALAHKVLGHSLPKALDPGEWGAAAARAGEKVDRALALPGVERSETIMLDHQHLKDIGKHLDEMHASDPSKAQALEGHLNSVVADHYNKSETIRGLVSKAHGDESFRATLHGVRVPSITGEVGRSAKNLATDAAALYGAAALTDEVRKALEPPKEKQSAMSNLQTAIDKLTSAANLLDRLPAREAAFSKAAKLADIGAIAESEIEKFASTFERNPEEADTIYSAVARGESEHQKLASFGEVVSADPSASGSRSGGSFEDQCRELAKSNRPW